MTAIAKKEWVNTLTTIQRRAGHYAGVTADETRVKTAQQEGRINSWVCPQLVYNPWDWSSTVYNTYIISPPDTRTAEERKQEKEDKRATNALKAGIICLIVGAALMGYSIFKWNSERAALNETEKAQKAFITVDTEGTVSQLFETHTKEKLGSLLNAVEALDRQRMIKANKLLSLATVFTAGATMMTTGGFATSMALITAGQITAVAAAAIGTGVLVYHWFADSELTLQAHEITRKSGELLEYLKTVSVPTTSADDQPPPYSLYPDIPPPPTFSGYWTQQKSPPDYYSTFFLPGHSQPTYAEPPPAY